MIRRDKFLSDIYGIEWMKYYGELWIPQMEEAIRQGEYDRLEFDVPATEAKVIKALIDKGCYLSSSKVTYKFDNNLPVNLTDPNYGEATLEDVLELAQLAADSFVLDRYRNDPYLDKSKIPILYKEWIANGIKGRSDRTIAYRENGRINGFTNTIIKPEELNIDLVGVRKDAERRGIGRGLIEKVKEHYPNQRLLCVTQAHNIPMQRTLQHAGFRLTETTYVLTVVK